MAFCKFSVTDIAQRSVQRALTPFMGVQFALSQPKKEVQTMPITKEYITLNKTGDLI